MATGGLAEEIERRRAEPEEGNIAIGGATLAARRPRLGLIDEYGMRVYPVLVAAASRSSRATSGAIWNSSRNRTFASKVLFLRYRVVR